MVFAVEWKTERVGDEHLEKEGAAGSSTGASAGVGRPVYCRSSRAWGLRPSPRRRDPGALDDLAARLYALRRGVAVEVLRADLHAGRTSAGSRAVCRRTISSRRQQCRIAVAGPTVEYGPDSLEAMVQLTIWSLQVTCRAVAPGLAKLAAAATSWMPSSAGLKGDQPSIVRRISPGQKAYILGFQRRSREPLAPEAYAFKPCCPVPPARDLGKAASKSTRCRRSHHRHRRHR